MVTKEALSERTRIKFRFKHDDFDFFFQWILGGQTHGGSEVGETFYVSSEIKDGDPESWSSAWTSLAKRVEARAKTSLDRGHGVSAGEAYLRPYYYHRAPLVFMDPKDSRYRSTYETARACFRKAAALHTPPIETFKIPFEDGALSGYFLKPDDDMKPRKTLMMFGGGDTFVEDLYFYIGPAGLKRGYNVFIVDLPGQGILPYGDLVMRADAEVPLKAVVDHVLSYPQVDRERLAAFGISAGMENRFVAAGGIGAPYLDVNKVRKQALAAQRRMPHKISGATSDEEHSRIMSSLEMERVISQVQRPSLIIHGSEDLVCDGPETNQRLSNAVRGPVTSKVIEGGDHLCSQFLKDWLADYIFDWYADRSKLSPQVTGERIEYEFSLRTST
jgi:pimeloyl-ACP methyl ester carboxylesterase